LENHPALRELLTALHADGFKLVLIEKLERLARDLLIQESIIADLNRHGFEIRSVAEPAPFGITPATASPASLRLVFQNGAWFDAIAPNRGDDR
jgi:DNA invertase Pin-like site-specific DNA recombinase